MAQYPELTAEPPQLAGQPSYGPSRLKLLRRQQLVDLARAYDIEIDRDGTKDEILPLMTIAESRGAFRASVEQTQLGPRVVIRALRPPLRPFYLVRANHTADDPPISQTPEEVAGIPDPDEIVRPVAKQTAYRIDQELKKECKELGIDSFGKSVAWMLGAIKQKHEELAAQGRPMPERAA